MKFFSLIFLFLLLGTIAGCNTRYVDVRGEKFEMISESEEQELVEHARLSLKTISKKIPPGDMKTIDTVAPKMRFIYSGDRYGRAIVTWKFPRYEVGVDYEGQLMTKYMNSTVFSRKKQPEVLDFSKRPSRYRISPRRGNTGNMNPKKESRK